MNEEDKYKLLKLGEEYCQSLINCNTLSKSDYYDLAYYCEDFFWIGFELEEDEYRFYYSRIFGNMGVIFCKNYMEKRGIEVFNNESDVNFIIEMAMFFDIAGKYNEQFYLLDSLVKNSKNDIYKIRAIEQILFIGDLGRSTLDKYKALKDNIMKRQVK